MPIFPLGKHKGLNFEDVPMDYLSWILTQDWPNAWLKNATKSELERRSAGPANPSFSEKSSASMSQHTKLAPEKSELMDRLTREQGLFAQELSIVRDNRGMLEDIIVRGEQARLATGQGDASVRRLCLALRRILGIAEMESENYLDNVQASV